jgi:hypothetical protein
MCQALFQADSVMSYRMQNQLTDIIITSDSDQAALLGPECVSIKDFRFIQGKKAAIKDIQIFVANEKTLQNISALLHIPFTSPKIVKAKYPVFDTVMCPRLRSLIAVSLGCDINLYPIN